MRLNRLQLVNFRQHVDSTFDFEDGLTGIIGPNGSGKSTVLEAIAWALYGNAAARGPRDSIRFTRAKPKTPVRVELTFELEGHRYHVVRGLTSAELYLDGAAEPIANSITKVGELLQMRLRMTHAEFFNTYFTGQKELDVMSAMGPTDRAQFLSRVLGYDRLRTAQALARDRRRVLSAELSLLKEGLPDAGVVESAVHDASARRVTADRRIAGVEQSLAAAIAALGEVEPRWSQAQRDRERSLRAETDRRVLLGEDASHVRDLERLGSELQETASARAELETLALEVAPLPALMVELQQLAALASDEGRRRTLVDAERMLADELGRLRERGERVATAPALEEEATVALEAKRHAVEEALARLEEARTAWVRDKQESETRHDALRKHYRDVKEQRDQVVALGEEGTCPTCSRPLGDHYRQVLDVLDAQLETVTVDGKFYQQRLEQLLETPDTVQGLDEQRRTLAQETVVLERRLAKVQAAVQELAQLGRDIGAKETHHSALRRAISEIPGGYDVARHDFVRREIDRVAPLDARQARLGGQAERAPKLVRERDRVAAQLASVRQRLSALGALPGEPVVSDADYAALRSAYDGAQQLARAAELDAVAARGESEAARSAAEQAARVQSEFVAVQHRIAARQGDRRLHEELDRALTDIRTDLNAQMRPELSVIAGALLDELTDGRYKRLELSDEYALTLIEDGAPKPVISGGEQDVASLAMRMAISQMIADRSGRAFSLLILDEVFGSLDRDRRALLIDTLGTLLGRFEQIIVITHIEETRDAFEHAYRVTYNDETGASDVTVDRGILDPAGLDVALNTAGTA